MHCSSRATLCVVSLAFLAACVSSPIPEGYTGPTATIRDSARPESGSRALFFYVAKIDGNAIKDSLAVTRQVNYGRGASLRAEASRGWRRDPPSQRANRSRYR